MPPENTEARLSSTSQFANRTCGLRSVHASIWLDEITPPQLAGRILGQYFFSLVAFGDINGSLPPNP
jgi:hypothetical protein